MDFDVVMAQCKRLTRLDGADYEGCRSAYYADRYQIYKAKKSVMQMAWLFRREGVPHGTVNRLTIDDNGVDYCAGQYAPTEIYPALERYLKACREW